MSKKLFNERNITALVRQGRISPEEGVALRETRSASDLKISAKSPRAAKAAARLLGQQLTDEDAIFEPGMNRNPLQLRYDANDTAKAVLDVLMRPNSIPIWAFDPSALEARSLPSDLAAELNMLTAITTYSAAAVFNPQPSVTGSRTTAGAATLSHPGAATDRPMVVPAISIEISQSQDASQLGQVDFSIAGDYWHGGLPYLDANAATTADHLTASPGGFSTGSAVFVARQRGKQRIILTPYKVIGAKTYVCPATLAKIDTLANAAVALTCTVNSMPAGHLVEFVAQGVDHAFFRRMYDQFASYLGFGTH